MPEDVKKDTELQDEGNHGSPTGEEGKSDKEYSEAEGSRLGRKIKSLEAELSSMAASNAAILEKLNEMSTKPPKDDVDLDEDEKPLTKEDIRRETEAALERKRKSDADAQQKYSKDYVKHAAKLNLDEADAEIANSILEEMDKNYNIRYSNDPVADAERNYNKAESAVLRRLAKGGKSVNPLDKNKGKAPASATGVAGGETKGGDDKGTSLKVELDDTAKEWAPKFGLSVEDINSALTTEGGFNGTKFESKGKIGK